MGDAKANHRMRTHMHTHMHTRMHTHMHTLAMEAMLPELQPAMEMRPSRVRKIPCASVSSSHIAASMPVNANIPIWSVTCVPAQIREARESASKRIGVRVRVMVGVRMRAEGGIQE